MPAPSVEVSGLWAAVVSSVAFIITLAGVQLAYPKLKSLALEPEDAAIKRFHERVWNIQLGQEAELFRLMDEEETLGGVEVHKQRQSRVLKHRIEIERFVSSSPPPPGPLPRHQLFHAYPTLGAISPSKKQGLLCTLGFCGGTMAFVPTGPPSVTDS